MLSSTNTFKLMLGYNQNRNAQTQHEQVLALGQHQKNKEIRKGQDDGLHSILVAHAQCFSSVAYQSQLLQLLDQLQSLSHQTELHLGLLLYMVNMVKLKVEPT
jgi:hypothetical protein